MYKTIAALILTKDEGEHTVRCIESLKGICEELFVVDNFSTDNTKELAESLGAKVYQHPWKNYATQLSTIYLGCNAFCKGRRAYAA